MHDPAIFKLFLQAQMKESVSRSLGEVVPMSGSLVFTSLDGDDKDDLQRGFLDALVYTARRDNGYSSFTEVARAWTAKRRSTYIFSRSNVQRMAYPTARSKCFSAKVGTAAPKKGGRVNSRSWKSI